MRLGLLALVAIGASACAGTKGPPSSPASPHATSVARVSAGDVAARTAEAMIGAPYRYGGASPAGFDCSGLVVYSYAAAGISGLPRTAASLERATRPVRLSALERGDLLFFRLDGAKTRHVAMYVGNRAFVHAPSGGKRVERVSFDHVYWSARLERAGRLAH